MGEGVFQDWVAGPFITGRCRLLDPPEQLRVIWWVSTPANCIKYVSFNVAVQCMQTHADVCRHTQTYADARRRPPGPLQTWAGDRCMLHRSQQTRRRGTVGCLCCRVAVAAGGLSGPVLGGTGKTGPVRETWFICHISDDLLVGFCHSSPASSD